MFKGKFISFVSLLLLLTLIAPVVSAQDRRRLGPRARAGMTAGAGASLGAGAGALLRGKRGAAAGALLGGGGATAAWLLKNKNSRRRLGKYGQPIATIGAGAGIGAGIGTLLGGRRGAGIGALLGGGGATVGYLLAKRNRDEYRDGYYRPSSAYYRPAYSRSYNRSRRSRPYYAGSRSRRSSRRYCRCS